MKAIEFSHFSCHYKNGKSFIQVLDDICLEIDEGELLALVGESGSGKTTLLKCIAGLCEYIEGDLHIFGVSTDDVKTEKFNVAYVHQQLALYPSMTVYENIAFPLRMIHTSQDEVDRRVKEIAEQMGIKLLLSRKPKQLSVGQQQRVAIARALIKNPRLILLDEPFSNIDPQLHNQLGAFIRQYHTQHNCTILFVTHDLREAFMLGERIAVLEQGKLVDIGTAEQLRMNANSALLKDYMQ